MNSTVKKLAAPRCNAQTHAHTHSPPICQILQRCFVTQTTLRLLCNCACIGVGLTGSKTSAILTQLHVPVCVCIHDLTATICQRGLEWQAGGGQPRSTLLLIASGAKGATLPIYVLLQVFLCVCVCVCVSTKAFLQQQQQRHSRVVVSIPNFLSKQQKLRKNQFNEKILPKSYAHK